MHFLVYKHALYPLSFLEVSVNLIASIYMIRRHAAPVGGGKQSGMFDAYRTLALCLSR